MVSFLFRRIAMLNRKGFILVICLFLGGCATAPRITDDQYCCGELGLVKGTHDYADCRMKMLEMHEAQTLRRRAAWQQSMYNMSNSFKQNREDIYLHPGY